MAHAEAMAKEAIELYVESLIALANLYRRRGEHDCTMDNGNLPKDAIHNTLMQAGLI